MKQGSAETSRDPRTISSNPYQSHLQLESNYSAHEIGEKRIQGFTYAPR